MEMQLENIGTKFGVSKKDILVIQDAVGAFPNNDLEGHKHFIERIFLTDIKPGHYLVLGFLVGFLDATDKVFANFYNNLKPCQRQN